VPAGKSVLFYDLGTLSGFCFGVPGEVPEYGSFRVGDEGASLGEFAAAFERQAYKHLLKYKPHCFCFESSYVGTQQSIASIRKGFGLAIMAEKCAWDCEVPVIRELGRPQIMVFFVGTARVKRDEGKRRVMEVCRALGFDPKNYDAADAIAGWSLQCSLLEPKARRFRWEGDLLKTGGRS